MKRASPAHLELARQVLDLEGSAGGGGVPQAACRVYEQLHTQLDPLLGSAGVHALLLRGARLAQQEGTSLEEAVRGGTTDLLRQRLGALSPSAAADASAQLFATFLALITTFIGERLTTQALKKAWPTLELAAPKESDK